MFLLAVHAPGQTEEELARARQLYGQGLAQEAAGDWAGALATFNQVGRIRMSSPVRFHIARCQENLGRLNEALGGYRLAEYEVEHAAQKNEELLGEIRTAREGLEARIPKLVIERGIGAETLKIELDGVALGPAKVGREVSVDPGPHSVTGVLSDGRRFNRTVEVSEGQTSRLRLDVPEEYRAAPQPAAGPSSGGSGDTTLDTAAPSQSVLPWVLTGIGAASLAASGVFFLLKNQAEDELAEGCLGKVCPDTLESTERRGRTYATLTGVTLGVGVVGVGVGTVMLLTSRPQPAARRIDLRVGAREVLVEGSF